MANPIKRYGDTPIIRCGPDDVDTWTRIKLWLRDQAFGTPFHGRYVPGDDVVEVGGVEPGGDFEEFIIEHECAHIDNNHAKAPLPLMARVCIYLGLATILSGILYGLGHVIAGLMITMASAHFFTAKVEAEADADLEYDIAQFDELKTPPNLVPYMALALYKLIDRSVFTTLGLIRGELRWMSRWLTIFR